LGEQVLRGYRADGTFWEKLGATVPRRPKMAENMALPKKFLRHVTCVVTRVYEALAPP